MQRIRTTTHSGWYYNRSLEYLTGEHVEVDAQKAFEFNAKAAQEGYHDAVLAMGWFYLNGIGVEKDIHEARTWYRKSARQGDKRAFYSLGYISYVQQNYHDARVWFERASQQGHAKSLYWLGKLYYKGYGVEHDQKKGFTLFHQAAKRKIPSAQRVLRWLNRPLSKNNIP